ncbi:class I lanthipeptide [Chitinophaga sp. HK235]|uniref:class I lanthipeptide n=1 Tax=Chitinophaga sp. HK235 TaxID=2952571 RepID=UPI001BABB3A6|nr:class I lanthipeptide [Chitinophaga sp. HK235]
MKKKTSLQKKMSFNKTMIASLSSQQQAMMAGGLPPITKQAVCQDQTYAVSCETIRFTADQCVSC